MECKEGVGVDTPLSRGNTFSQNSGVRARLSREARKVELLEESVITPIEVPKTSSTFPETLLVMESRQYRERGLLRVTDVTYDLSMSGQQERVDKINQGELR